MNKDNDFLNLCRLFDLSPFHWRWQLNVEDGVITCTLDDDPRQERFRLGGPLQPSISCTRLAAMISLAAGKHADALRWAHQAGTRVDLLQAELQRILAGRAPARRPPGIREIRVVDPIEKAKSDAAVARIKAAQSALH